MTVAAVTMAAMMEQVHQGARQQQQVGQESEEVGPVLGQQEEQRNDQEHRECDLPARRALRLGRTSCLLTSCMLSVIVVVHGMPFMGWNRIRSRNRNADSLLLPDSGWRGTARFRWQISCGALRTVDMNQARVEASSDMTNL